MTRPTGIKVRRALFSTSDKSGIVELALAMAKTGTEIVATGKTAGVLRDAGLEVTPIEQISGAPESFQGRMKTLSFPVCSGILYRRGNSSDEADLERLKLSPIDAVVVNFYPFEKAAKNSNLSRSQLIEEIDIGGPTMVRSAAKNAEHVVTLCDPNQYSSVISELNKTGEVSIELSQKCAARAWEKVLKYDAAIESEFGPSVKLALRYGENPHQEATLQVDPDGPIAWNEKLTSTDLSYNNILDFTAGYQLASELKESLGEEASIVVIIKHNNPCGVGWVPKTQASAQLKALQLAWQGDPISAFGGVVVFSEPLEQDSATYLAKNFVELVGAPHLDSKSVALGILKERRKKLKAVSIRRFEKMQKSMVTEVPGGVLRQTQDSGWFESEEKLCSVTETAWPESKNRLAKFGILVCRQVRSNAIVLVQDSPQIQGALQLVGVGQGQPNRIEALKKLAVPRAKSVLETTGGRIDDCVLVSDAFFPFRDSVDEAHQEGVRWIIQPGGSLKDGDSIAACNEHRIGMIMTGVRHFRH